MCLGGQEVEQVGGVVQDLNPLGRWNGSLK